MGDKRLSLKEAIAEYVQDDLSVAIEGFTAFICFAAGHEIIRQRRRNLTLIRMTPDVIYDQMVAAGVARKLVFSYLGNPGVGPLHCLRRAIERGIPTPLAIEEYSHYGMVGRYLAGASHLPFFPLRSYLGSEMPQVNEQIKMVHSPYGEDVVAVVPPLNPDVAIIHAQRADRQGNTQFWGLLGVQKEVAFAAQRVIVVVEEIVEESIIRADPNRTLIPGLIVDAVVQVPYGAHPSYVQGYYDRDTDKALFDFANAEREMQLVSLHPGVTLEAITADIGWEVRVAETLTETPAPTADELAVMRRLSAGSTSSTRVTGEV